MQLTPPNVRQALALATCALLPGTGHAAEGDWSVASSVLFYEETDRVSVVAPMVFATRDLGDEQSVTLRAVYDSLTGASPNGATPTNTAQTFTGASGLTGYTTPAGETPLKKFEDTRIALGVDWAGRTSSDTARTLTANVSREEDYFSLGGSGTWTRDVNNKLTTLALGLGVSADVVQATGGAPTGLQSISAVQTTTCASGTTGASLQRRDDDGDGEGDDDGCGGDDGEQKLVTDLMLGVTQVLSRRTLMQLNYTLSRSSGYLTDPYKIVSVVDPVTGATVDYVYEKRPSERIANILYWKTVHHFDEDVAHLSYRYFTDDWGVTAHTAELQYHFKLGERFYLEPQYRIHQQSAADFYHHSLPGNATVDYASADLRLGEMTSTTVGLKVGARVGEGELSLRAARMVQTGDSHPDDAIGIQRQFDLYPTLEASIINIGYSTPL